jgi:hypothetical protein
MVAPLYVRMTVGWVGPPRTAFRAHADTPLEGSSAYMPTPPYFSLLVNVFLNFATFGATTKAQ